MSYQPKATGERIILDVIARADESLVGFSFKNITFYSVPYVEFATLVKQTTNGQDLGLLQAGLLEHEIDFTSKNLLVQEYLPATPRDKYYSFFPKLLRLFKAFDFYSCYNTTYRFDGTTLTPGGGIRVYGYYKHANIEFKQPAYSFTVEEKEAFHCWYEQYAPQILGKKNNEFRRMLETYNESFLVGKIAPQYIMLFTILEAIFGTGNSEITYQVSRGISLLLSKSEIEMKAIYSIMKKLYSVRSQYVHGGKDIKQDDLFTLREFTRQLILKLIDLGYNQVGADFKKLQDLLTYAGAGMFAQA